MLWSGLGIPSKCKPSWSLQSLPNLSHHNSPGAACASHSHRPPSFRWREIAIGLIRHLLSLCNSTAYNLLADLSNKISPATGIIRLWIIFKKAAGIVIITRFVIKYEILREFHSIFFVLLHDSSHPTTSIASTWISKLCIWFHKW